MSDAKWNRTVYSFILCQLFFYYLIIDILDTYTYVICKQKMSCKDEEKVIA